MDSDSDLEDVQQELDDQEGFDDFTVASSWERVISDIERACRKWQSFHPKRLLTAGAVLTEGYEDLYQVQTELAYRFKDYRLTLFFQIDSRDGSSEEWRATMHHLQLWFGVNDFLVIAPMNMSGVILDAPEATVLLSAVAIALSNCGSYWPAFVPVHDPTRKAYAGIQGMKGPYSRSFEADRIGSQVPVKLMHLEGLYDLFVSKVAFSLPDPTTHLNVKVRFTMRLTYHTPMPGFEYAQSEDGASPIAEPVANYDGDISEKVQWDEECPWAEWYTVDDPVKGFELTTIWASRLVESPVEMAEFENVSTFEADKWLLQLILTKGLNNTQRDEQVSFAARLQSLVTAFSLSKEAQFMEDFAAGDKPEMEKYLQGTNVPPPGVLDRILKELFHEGPLLYGSRKNTTHHLTQAIKGAPTDSLFSQFCLHALWFGTCNIRAIAIFWTEFVREVRWCWEELQPLPRMSPEQPPDLDTCLLHQKLQLLAVCISRKAAEHRNLSSKKSDIGQSEKVTADTTGTGMEGISDNADNFLELFPSKEVGSLDGGSDSALKPGPHIIESNISSEPVIATDYVHEHSTSEQEEQRRGSAGPFVDLMLLKSCQRLHAPVTQEPPIMTEDMLLEREHAIVALSNSPSGKMALSRLQSEILAADMAAFKAANPGSTLEDFVRWHSPCDWMEDDQVAKNSSIDPGVDCKNQESLEGLWPPSGRLSRRMSEPGNTWDQIWRTVHEKPASEQKPLFDHTREGEKVIHYLETLRPHQLLSQMVCTAFAATANFLYQTDTGELHPLVVELDQLYFTIVSILEPLRTLNIRGFVDEELSANMEEWCTDFMELCRVFEQTEKHVILASSLCQKLPKAHRLVNALFCGYVKMEKQERSTSSTATASSSDRQDKRICRVVSMSERDTVTSLFPPLSSSETWKKSLRMGNFLNGHEPLMREVIFAHFDHYFQGQRERYRIEDATITQLLSHRMYICGTSNDLQVAYSLVSND